MKTLAELLQDYTKEQRTFTDQNLAGCLRRSTLKNYLCRLRAFAAHLGNDATPSDITPPAMRTYCLHLCAEKGSAMRMHLASVRHFCNWLRFQGWLEGDPCANVPATKVSDVRRTPVPEEAIGILLNACDHLPRSPYRRALAKAVMNIFIHAALRRAECLDLHLTDYNTGERSLSVRDGKGGKSRTVRLPDEAATVIDAYIAVRPRTDQPYLLMLDTRWRLGVRGLQTLLGDLHDVAGLTERYTPHQFRHACATRMVKNGAPLVAVSKVLGHSKLETLGRYVHIDEEQLQQAADCSSLRKPESKQEEPKQEERRERVERSRYDRARRPGRQPVSRRAEGSRQEEGIKAFRVEIEERMAKMQAEQAAMMNSLLLEMRGMLASQAGAVRQEAPQPRQVSRREVIRR